MTSLFHSVDSKKFKQKKSSWYEHMERDLSHTQKMAERNIRTAKGRKRE